MVIGVVEDEYVVLERSPDTDRMSSRGLFGIPLSEGRLRLDLAEAAYLIDQGRIQVQKEGSDMGAYDLLLMGRDRIQRLDLLYVVYVDLRSRGLIPRIGSEEDGQLRVFDRGSNRKTATRWWISVADARDELDPFVLDQERHRLDRLGKEFVVAVIDDDGELTYYDLSRQRPKGNTTYPGLGLPDGKQSTGMRVEGRVLLNTPYPPSPARRNEMAVSFVEAAHGVKHGQLVVEDDGKKLEWTDLITPELLPRLRVFEDLTSRDTLPRSGFKYGTHFRLYLGDPEEKKNHSHFLVEVVTSKWRVPWSQLCGAVRLCHGVRKKYLLALVNDEEIQYLRFDRVLL